MDKKVTLAQLKEVLWTRGITIRYNEVIQEARMPIIFPTLANVQRSIRNQYLPDQRADHQYGRH